MASLRRRELLQILYRSEAKAPLLVLLAASPSLRIAVPCAQLSPAAAGTGSRVSVAIKATHPGGEVLLDCGVYWSGAPPGPVAMHYTALLAHADEDTLEGLVSRLDQAPCLTPSHPLRPSPAPGKLAVSTLARALSQEESGLGVATPSPQAGRPQGPAAYASAPQRTLPRMLLSSVEESAPRSPCAPPGGGPGSDWAGTASPVGSSLVEDLDACPTPPFSNVFTPPWAAASPEARRGPALTGRPGADAAARIAAAMAHMGAATPHLAEALADIASAHGAGNALFAQTHDLLNRVLEMKDDAQHALDRSTMLACAQRGACLA
ncbi:hypothetical protein ACKKBF_B19285 [Auxenochlorella protothecoides x Auxenochlorella symbiontica]